jgi:hypothetical protein
VSDSQAEMSHLDSLSADALMLRREALLDTCSKDGVRDFATLSDDALQEMFYINRLLRRKNSGPPKAKKPNGASAGIDDLD